MRIYEDDYAYEIERVLDPLTEILKGWRYKVYRVRPRDEMLQSGEVGSKEAAELAGRRALEEIKKAEQKGQDWRKKRAA
jgi:hypothetical protein